VRPACPQLSLLVRDAALAEVAVAAETLRFDTLSNSQFIENVRACRAARRVSPCVRL
jgi:hypothetical protein